MFVDKDKPRTWKKYTNGMCNGCMSYCCSMPVEIKLSDLLRLELITEDDLQDGPKKIAKKLIKEKYIKNYRQGTEFFMLESKPNGDCIFLDQNRLCSVYEKRPETCRKFPDIGPRPGHCPSVLKPKK